MMPSGLTRRAWLAALAGLIIWTATGGAQTPATVTRSTFASQIAALSEGEGYFDTDNLISNEQRYLSVVPDLRASGTGGAYIGVGPDQNFSYIAATRPAIAIMIDIRRDNLLLHLLFKALFAEARTRVEYLALWTGRPVPPGVTTASAAAGGWSDRPIADLVSYVDRATPLDPPALAKLRARLTATVTSFGVPLSTEDHATIDRFHRRFIDAGLSLQFQSTGRPPQAGYPTLRQLLLATDDNGRRANYLASEDGFQFLKSLQARDLVIPIVGNLGGPTALKAVGRLLRERQQPLATFYASNVEFYLRRDGTYPRFVDNLASLPRHPNALIIRSIFGGGGGGSYSETQKVSELVSSR